MLEQFVPDFLLSRYSSKSLPFRLCDTVSPFLLFNNMQPHPHKQRIKLFAHFLFYFYVLINKRKLCGGGEEYRASN